MSKSPFRTKQISKIIADAEAGAISSHGTSLHRVLTVRDLTFFWYSSYYWGWEFQQYGIRCGQWGTWRHFSLYHVWYCLRIYSDVLCRIRESYPGGR